MGVIRLAQWVWKLRDELRDSCLEKQKDGKEGEGGKHPYSNDAFA